VLLGTFAAVVVGLVIARRQVALVGGRAMRKMPVLRDLVLAQESARFFSVMSAMARSGVPLADALGVANEAVGHPKLRVQLGQLRQKLIDGGLLRVLIDNVSALPLATRRLLIAAERSGDLETAFEGLSSDLADEVERRAARMMAILEPGVILLMFGLVGPVILAIMIPLLTLTAKAM
jgi:general secretion pathway protein F